MMLHLLQHLCFLHSALFEIGLHPDNAFLSCASVDSATQRQRQAAALLRDLGEPDGASGASLFVPWAEHSPHHQVLFITFT